MHMAPRAAAWVAWAAWICNYRSNGSCDQERADFASALFLPSTLRALLSTACRSAEKNRLLGLEHGMIRAGFSARPIGMTLHLEAVGLQSLRISDQTHRGGRPELRYLAGCKTRSLGNPVEARCENGRVGCRAQHDLDAGYIRGIGQTGNRTRVGELHLVHHVGLRSNRQRQRCRHVVPDPLFEHRADPGSGLEIVVLGNLRLEGLGNLRVSNGRAEEV